MTAPDKYQHLKQSARITGRGLLILLITLILLEIVLGIVFRIKDRNLIEAEVSDYPFMYFRLNPEEGLRNSDGFKTKYTREKPDSITRIAITGGSVAFGNEPENSIAAYLEKELNQEQNVQGFQVINAGVPAFVIEQEFIMIQLVLQYYKPDIIVSLSGYNDLMSVDINRSSNSTNLLPPHNWNDFKCIEANSRKKLLTARFAGIFPNIARLFDFVKRKTADDEALYANLSQQSESIASTYAARVADTHDFCQAKRIVYIHCLQPVNWEINSNNPTRNKALKQIYSNMQTALDTCGYYLNLTQVFAKEPGVFTDECHVTKEGNEEFARRMKEDITKHAK